MMKRIIRVGYVCESNPFEDRTAWSGLNFKIRESIENAGFEVVWINSRPNGKVSKLCKLWNEFWHGKTTMFEHTRIFFRLRAHAIDKTLLRNCDILFFPRRAQIMKYLNCDLPYIYYSDATFCLMVGYYWDGLTKWQQKTGEELENIAIRRSAFNIRASHWARYSVVRDYGFSESRTSVLRFGANIDDQDITPVPIYTGDGCLNILFSGVDWERKGAEIAIKTVELLNNMGITSCLYLVGIRHLPESYCNNSHIRHVGYLDKNNPEEYKQYVEVVKMCHLFLLPTRAECAGIVFGEASACEMPIFTYDTGGIPDYVYNGINGFRLPISAGPEQFADIIKENLSVEKLITLRAGCRKIYEQKLNWKVWSKSFRDIITNQQVLHAIQNK